MSNKWKKNCYSCSVGLTSWYKSTRADSETLTFKDPLYSLSKHQDAIFPFKNHKKIPYFWNLRVILEFNVISFIFTINSSKNNIKVATKLSKYLEKWQSCSPSESLRNFLTPTPGFRLSVKPTPDSDSDSRSENVPTLTPGFRLPTLSENFQTPDYPYVKKVRVGKKRVGVGQNARFRLPTHFNKFSDSLSRLLKKCSESRLLKKNFRLPTRLLKKNL